MMITQVMKRYKDIKFSWHFAMKALIFVIFLFLITVLFRQFTDSPHFPIQEVKIVGVKHIDHQELKHLLKPLVSKSFFRVNVEQIHDQLMQLPWISDVYVKRIWPSEILIQIAEKIPLARWNDNSLLSAQGEIFSPSNVTLLNHLPQFMGPDGEQIRMLDYYTNINSLLSPLHFKIARFELTQAGSWSITFENGMRLNVGYKDVLTRIDHFVKVYPKIVGKRVSEVDYVDLRYSNGLVVRWKTLT